MTSFSVVGPMKVLLEQLKVCNSYEFALIMMARSSSLTSENEFQIQT